VQNPQKNTFPLHESYLSLIIFDFLPSFQVSVGSAFSGQYSMRKQPPCQISRSVSLLLTLLSFSLSPHFQKYLGSQFDLSLENVYHGVAALTGVSGRREALK